VSQRQFLNEITFMNDAFYVTNIIMLFVTCRSRQEPEEFSHLGSSSVLSNSDRAYLNKAFVPRRLVDHLHFLDVDINRVIIHRLRNILLYVPLFITTERFLDHYQFLTFQRITYIVWIIGIEDIAVIRCSPMH
jgi:hypothetical protein